MSGFRRAASMDEFDEVLLKTVDKTLRHILGDRNALIIYDYLEKSFCPIHEIPRRLDLFSAKLRDLLGTSRGQILGVPSILEDAIVEALSRELGLSPEKGPAVLQDRIRRLKERYTSERSQEKRHQNIQAYVKDKEKLVLARSSGTNSKSPLWLT
jgi:hypothetical protein